MNSCTHCSGTGTRLAEAGYAVYGIDYEGHGKSSGLQGYIPSFDNLVNDCSNYFISICGMKYYYNYCKFQSWTQFVFNLFSVIQEKPENKKRRRFLLGESMGGAVLLLLHRKEPSFWDGAILVAPMCKVCSSSLFIYLFIYFEFFFF